MIILAVISVQLKIYTGNILFHQILRLKEKREKKKKKFKEQRFKDERKRREKEKSVFLQEQNVFVSHLLMF